MPREVAAPGKCCCAETTPAPADAPFHWLATCPYLSKRDRAIVARAYVQPRASRPRSTP